jgi:heavy metal sensor kinase
MPTPGLRTRFTRRLGFRLTASYLVFFTLLLVLVGAAFRQMLVDIQESQLRELLEGDWVALKGYLRPTNSGLAWDYDHEDPQESFLVERLRRVLLVTDDQGKILEISPAFRVIGVNSPSEIRKILQAPSSVWETRVDPWGLSYRIRAGSYLEPGSRRYFVAIGRSTTLSDVVVRQFTWRYFTFLPFIVVLGGLLGWFLTRQALHPLNEVVQASESITGSNLHLRIQLRGAGDELDRLIDTFNRMIERLESSFQQMRQFTADVSHELRTPITAVRGQLEVALMTASGEAQLREAALTALEETERLSEFVKAMLQLSQAESGQLALKKENRDLCPIIRDIIEQVRILAEDAGLRLVAEMPGRCDLEADRIQIERLLYNLLSNAIKYTPTGGEVRLELRRRQHRVEIVVEDTGRGIPAEHLPHIFERFYRVPSTDSSDTRGLGLGLSFVAWIVKAHGGRINVTSTPGRGTRFEVTLPATQHEHADKTS